VAATNSAGTSKGLILSFDTVAPPPTVVTSAATSITSSGAILNGTVNPNGLATDAHFEWGIDPALASPSTTSTQAMGSGGSAAPITASVSGLSPGTTYYFRVVATNAGGTSQGTPILDFTTPFSPAVTTNIPTSITTTSAVFNGTANPNGLSTDAWFEYGTDPSLSSSTSTAGQGMGTGPSPVPYSKSVSGLSSYTTYYYRAAASNSGGTQKGVIKSFLTGETYVAVGDSITAGSGDDIPGDGTGFEPILGNLLGVMIANEGVSGDTSADGAASIDNTLAAYPSADYYLILYGSNDAFNPPVPSGLGLNPGDPGYSGSYKENMQQIISAIISAGKTPYLAKVPYTTDVRIRDASIQDYNVVIDELRVSNGISVAAPDFYTWFLNHPSQLADGVHPNGTGYQSMADLWFNALP
jgi:lysophospholipase L1-like esterase